MKKNIILLLSLFIGSIYCSYSQNNILVLRDTIYHANDSIEIIVNEIDTSNNYNKNILFHLLDNENQNSNPNARIIPNTCEIPVDTDCHGCNFENTNEITTEYWGASTEMFYNNGDVQILLSNNNACNDGISYPIDPDEQCVCSGYGSMISTPVYFCSQNTNNILNINYKNCTNNNIHPLSDQNNHFRMVRYNDIYTEIGLDTNTCNFFSNHFGSNVLKLGDDYVGARLSTLIKKIVVTEENQIIKFDFALVLENPHSGLDNPSFNVQIFNNQRDGVTQDANGKSRVDLGWGNYEIFSHHPNLKTPPSKPEYRYMDWSCGKIDLSDFAVGDTVYILFEQRDCAPTGHWSKAYIDNIGNSLCDNITESIVTYNPNISYLCGDSIALFFDYELPVSTINNETIYGDLEITLNLFQGSSGIGTLKSGNITSSNNQNGRYVFIIPKSTFPNYIDATFSYSTISSIDCYNFIPNIFEQKINIPITNRCGVECADYSHLPADTNIINTYALDENFKVITNPSNPTNGNISIVKEGEDPSVYQSSPPNNIPNACLSSNSTSGVGIVDQSRKFNLFFIFKDPVDSFSLRLLDFGDQNSYLSGESKVFLKAYTILGDVVDIDSLVFTIPVGNAGDACLATPSSKHTVTKDPGNYTLFSNGHRISKIELLFKNNALFSEEKRDYASDASMVVTDMCYVKSCIAPEIAPIQALCTGDSLLISDLNYNDEKIYLWAGPNGFAANGANISIPNANSSHNGTYVLRSYSPNCGYLYDTVEVSVIDIDGNLGSDTLLCQGQSLILDATTSGASYLWKGGSTSSTLIVDTTGLYWVNVTKNSCIKQDTIKVVFIDSMKIQTMPYNTRHNCVDDNSGILQLIWNEAIGVNKTVGSNPQINTYINGLSYTIYQDNIYNYTFDEQCAFHIRSGSLETENRDSLFINNLPLGDFKIILKPTNVCRKEIVGGSTIDSVCMPYEVCNSDSFTFTFSIRKHSYPPPLGADKILCPDAKVSIQVPARYYDDKTPVSIHWGNVCGIYDENFNIITKQSSSVSTDTIRKDLVNGQGGLHTVEILTQDGCIIRDTIVVADLKPLIRPDSMPSAIATNAVQYSSSWAPQYSSIKWEDDEILEIFQAANIYQKGEAGIYRPSKNHDYLDSLNSSAGFTTSYTGLEPSTQLSEISIRNTGNIMPYKLFNYGNPLFADCVPQWIHNSTMTKYSPSGFDVENRDIMGIHGSALYGYNDMLPIAVASNAKNDEIGYESFEEYSKDINALNYYNNITQLNNSTGNIELVRQTASLFMPKTKTYDIVRAFNRYAMIKGNICSACDEPFMVTGNAVSAPIDIRTEKIIDRKFTSYTTNIVASPCGDSSYTILQLSSSPTDEKEFRCRFWTGKINVTEKRFVPQLGTYNFILDDTKAHTGKYSLKVPKEQRIFLPQVDLELQPKKTYHIGAWIHSSSMNTKSPENLKYAHIADSIGITIKLPNNETVFIVPSGEVVNGWQKLEGTFTMPAGMRTQIELGFHSFEDFNIDDIRIYPQNSAIQTYVYDANNYKVKAVLDQNNYATMYSYDDEGNLFAIKKETVKGIKTIQVSSSHLKSEKP